MIRTNLVFNITGKSKQEIELKLKERVAKYLEVEVDDVEEKVEIEMFIIVGEEGPLQLTFLADCKVKVKS
jgi:hypothetical protein